MSISTTIGGVIKEIIAPSTTVGGVVHEFNTVYTVSDGVLRKIFSKGGSGELPTELEWEENTTWKNTSTSTPAYSYSRINSTSNSGFTISFTVNNHKNYWHGTTSSTVLVPSLFSEPMFLPAGTTITVTKNSMSGGGSTMTSVSMIIHPANNYNTVIDSVGFASVQSAITTGSCVIEEDGEYVLGIEGNSFTAGQTYTYYDVRGEFTITFSA